MAGEGRWLRWARTVSCCVLPAALVVAAVFCLADHYGKRSGGSAGSFNSDDLYTIDVCRQVAAGYDLRGYHLPAAPYVFPDMVLQIPGMVLSADHGIVFLVYGLLYYGLCAVGIAWIARQCGLSWVEGCWHGCCGVALLLATHLGPSYVPRGTLLAHPGNHAGFILVGLFLVGLCLRLVRHGPGVPSTAGFLIAGSLTAFSDRLLVVGFLAPLSLALLVLACLRCLSPRRLLVGAVWIGGAVVLAEAVRWAAARYGIILLSVDVQGKLAEPGEMWGFLISRLPLYFSGQPVAVAVIVAATMAALAAAIHGVLRRRGEVLLAALVCLLCCLANVAAVLLLSGGPTDAAAGRFLLALVLLPFFFVGLFVRLLPGRLGRAGLGVLAAAAIVAVVQLVPQVAAFDGRHLRQPYPDLARAVDELARERGCRFGLADYWTARHISLLSREGVTLKALAGNGAPWLHADNPNSYLAPGAEATLPRYGFIVMARSPRPCSLSPLAVLGLYGEPVERRIVDADWELWVYDQLGCSRLNRFLVGVLAQRYRAAHRCEAPVQPRQLARPRANLSRKDRLDNVVVPAGQSVEVRFGRPLTAEAIDLAADAGKSFQVTLYHDEQRLGALQAPACWTGLVYEYDPHNMHSLFSRLLPMPAELKGRPWNRAVIRCLNRGKKARLGHFLVHAQAPALPPLGPPGPQRPRRFEAEALSTSSHDALRIVACSSASGGRYCLAGKEFAGPVVFGPGIALEPGRYRVNFAVRADGRAGTGPIGHVDIAVELGRRTLAQRDLDAGTVAGEDGFRTVSLILESNEELDSVEFRVFSHGGTRLAVDYVDLVPLAAGREAVR